MTKLILLRQYLNLFVGELRMGSVGKMKLVEANGMLFLLVNVASEYYAITGQMPSWGCKLSNGLLDGEIVKCPCHGSKPILRLAKWYMDLQPTQNLISQ